MKSAFALTLTLTTLLVGPAFASESGEAPYPFHEMNCTGTLSPNSNLSDDWKSLAIRVVNSPHQTTDILGQTRSFDLKWNYSFGKTIEEARRSLNSPSNGGVSFESPGLTQRTTGNQTIVSFKDHYYNEEYLHLTLRSSVGTQDNFLGTFLNPSSLPTAPEIYYVACTASR